MTPQTLKCSALDPCVTHDQWETYFTMYILIKGSIQSVVLKYSLLLKLKGFYFLSRCSAHLQRYRFRGALSDYLRYVSPSLSKGRGHTFPSFPCPRRTSPLQTAQLAHDPASWRLSGHKDSL